MYRLFQECNALYRSTLERCRTSEADNVEILKLLHPELGEADWCFGSDDPKKLLLRVEVFCSGSSRGLHLLTQRRGLSRIFDRFRTFVSFNSGTGQYKGHTRLQVLDCCWSTNTCDILVGHAHNVVITIVSVLEKKPRIIDLETQ